MQLKSFATKAFVVFLFILAFVGYLFIAHWVLTVAQGSFLEAILGAIGMIACYLAGCFVAYITKDTCRCCETELE